MEKFKEKIKEKGSFKAYIRLMKYAGPYKYKLMIGVIAGFLASGSLFGSMLMVPYLVKGIERNNSTTTPKMEKSAEAVVQSLDSAKDLSDAEKREIVKKIIFRPEAQSKIEKEIEKADAKLKMFAPEGVNLLYNQGNIEFKWNSFVFDFPAETPTGKMTWQFFSVFVFGFIMLWIIRNICIFVNNYYTRWVGTRVITDLRDEAFSVLMKQSLRFYGKMDIGQMISRTTNDTSAIESSVAHTVADATRCPIEILACLVAIIMASVQHSNWILPIILFVGLPLCVLPVIIIGRKIRKIYKKSFGQIAEVVTRMHEVFSSILIVKAYHAEKREVGVFRRVNEKYFITVNKALKAQLMMAPLMEIVAVSTTLVFLVFSYSQEVSLTELAQLLVPCFMAYTPIKNLAKVVTYVQRSMAAADRYFQLIDIDTSLKENPNGVELREFNRSIEFENVAFAYDRKKILDGVTFSIPKGHVVAVVGETGSGKTTIANLIARFYDVDSGKVTIDGNDVRDIKVEYLRDMIGIVTQDALLFNTSIANNIAYGCPDASREQITEAAKQANAHQFIVDGRHREGYDTVIGEKGFKLSGGEKQRISIARAILKNPPILILDEATSALDTVTEKLVQDALNRVMTNRTVFAIAHRLSTIMHANMIIVLDKGHIIECGTHEQLMALGGRYKKLHDTQFGRKQEETEPEEEPAGETQQA